MDPETTFMSIEEILRIFYFLGITTCSKWDACMHNIRMDVMNLDCDNYADVINVYMKLIALGRRIRFGLEIYLNVNSQEKLSLIDTYLFDLTDIYDYLRENVNNFDEKNIHKTTFNVINSFVKNFLFPNNTDTDIVMQNESFENVDDDNNDDDDDEEEVDNEFDEIFKSVKVKKGNSNSTSLYEQSVLFNSHGDKKMLTTPGEKGAYLIKIEITDTKDLKGVEKNDRWQKAAYKAVFLLQSNKDPNYNTLYKMILNKSRELTKIKNVKKRSFTKFNK